MMFNFGSIYFYFYLRVRALVKWFLRKTTNLCELQRICYGKPVGFVRTDSVEYSLLYSQIPEIQLMIKTLNGIAERRRFSGRNQKIVLEQSVKTILIVKQVKPNIHKQFIVSLTRCFEHIWGYKQLVHEVESLRLTTFDSSNEDHEDKLQRLWQALMPDIPLETRITKQWQDIGFQGDDPKTDFRGMGMLGLENLLYFAEEYTNAARHVHLHSIHPKYGYAFAIVGINLTSMVYNLLKDGSAKTHIYNACKSLPSIRAFHQLYSCLFYEFDKFWIESKPKDVMEFSNIRNQFETNIRDALTNPSTVFHINFVVDTI
ncbi:unnamed protein product [Nezara viridula]|uniref:ELMO domain-containing protein n=1 Tax=Nezara viridula TaxID=85310 RepID=A0A9P0MT40_NEZVI|nr:unnamed protein product [Nezara viridula]